MSDLAYAARGLRKSPLFATAVVLTLALGIGANTAIFSVVNGVLLQPLPFSEPDRLVWVAERNDKLNLPTFAASALNYLSWKEQTRTLEPLGAIGFASFNLSGGGDPEQLSGSTLTSSIFPLLGLRAVAGRAFEEGEDKPGSPLVTMLSEGLWKRRFGGDASLIGQNVTLNGALYQVVGVVPSALAVIANSDVFVPLSIDPGREKRLNHVTTVVGRLRPGLSLQQAQAEMDSVARRVGQEYPEAADWGIRLVTFPRWLVADQLRIALLVLLGAVAGVLLIACANVANLLLARGVARERELAVRMALGASRGRVLRQFLLESLILSLAGGAAGLLAAFWAVHLASASLPVNLLPVPAVRVDAAVLCFTLGVSIATGLLFGVAPGWHAARTESSLVLKHVSRSATGGARPLLRKALSAAELALATVLLIGAGLLVQSLRQLERVELGFRPEGLLTFQLALPPAQYPPDGRAFAFYRELLESLQSLPGVRAAAISSGVPFGVGNYTATPVAPIGKSALPPGTALTVDWRLVSPGYFHTLLIPVLRGRVFNDTDDASGPPVIVVSQMTAAKFWGADDPLGRTVQRVADGREFTVIGVVGDTRNTTLNQQAPAMYFSSGARLWPLMDVVVRVDGRPESVLSGVRQRVKALDPALPIANVRSMEEWVRNSAAQPRLDATLLGVFAGVALLIAGIGTYSVLAYAVSQRTREIGLRMALGAQPGRIVRSIVGEGLVLGLIGIGGGVLGALALGRALTSLVFGVAVRDPATFAGVAIAVAAIALVACALPARRASRVDPMVALRCD